MKSNGGTLVIDDFGRQRGSAAGSFEPLDRTLERRVDYLAAAHRKEIEVPFEQLVCFRPTSMKRISPTGFPATHGLSGARRATNTRSLHRDLQAQARPSWHRSRSASVGPTS